MAKTDDLCYTIGITSNKESEMKATTLIPQINDLLRTSDHDHFYTNSFYFALRYPTSKRSG